MLSAQEIADRLGISEKTVRRWVKDGRLVAAKTGNVYAIRLSDAEALFRASRAGRGAAASSTLETRVTTLEREVAEWKARYEESRAREERLEIALREEVRRSARLEEAGGFPAAA